MKSCFLVVSFLIITLGVLFLLFRPTKLAWLQILRDDQIVAEFEVEVADDPAERAKGLMFREQLDENVGMLFVFPREDNHSFWMKKTYVPLDIIFADQNKKIVGIIENTRPESTQSLTIGQPSKYILEINGGRTEEIGITAGDKLKFK